MPNIEVLAVEIKRFHGTTAQTLVPRVIGRIAAGTRGPGRSGQRLTRESFLDGFEDDAVRGVAERLLDAAVQSGADIWYGNTFGLSVRARCSAWPRPISIAWLYTQPGRGWMRTRDFSFGVAAYGVDSTFCPAPSIRLSAVPAPIHGSAAWIGRPTRRC